MASKVRTSTGTPFQWISASPSVALRLFNSWSRSSAPTQSAAEKSATATRAACTEGPLMPDQGGFHQVMQIAGLVEIQRLGVAFDFQRRIGGDFAAEIFA